MKEREILLEAMEERQKDIEAEKKEELRILAELGKAVFDSRDKIEPERLDLREAESCADEILSLEENLARLPLQEERRQSLADEARALRVEARNLKNRLESLFTELGKAAWADWKNGDVESDVMEEALADLIKSHEKLASENSQTASEDGEVPETGGVKKLLSRGRKLFLAGRRRTFEAVRDWQWGKAGRRVRELVTFESLSGTRAGDVMESMKDLQNRQREIALRESALAEEVASLDADLDEMPGKGKIRKRRSWMESAVGGWKKEQDDVFLRLGQSALELEMREVISGIPEVKPVLKDWQTLQDKIEQLQAEESAVQARLALLDLEKERDVKAERMARLEEEIKSRQAKLRAMKKELTAAEKTIAETRQTLPELPADVAARAGGQSRDEEGGPEDAAE